MRLAGLAAKSAHRYVSAWCWHPVPSRNPGEAKSRTANSGAVQARSHTTKAAVVSKPTIRAVSTGTDSQPESGASMRPHRIETAPRIANRAPADPETTAARTPALGEDGEGENECCQGNGDIKQENRTEPEVVEQDTTGDGTDHDAEANGGGPGAEGRGPFAWIGKE